MGTDRASPQGRDCVHRATRKGRGSPPMGWLARTLASPGFQTGHAVRSGEHYLGPPSVAHTGLARPSAVDLPFRWMR